MSNTPRYVGFLDPPYNVTLTDDSGAALDLTGCISSSFTLTMINTTTGLSQQGGGVWTVANQSTNKGQASYQWTTSDMATAGFWEIYTTVKLPAEPSPREMDPELIQILPGTVGAGAAPPGVLPNPAATLPFLNIRDFGGIGDGLTDCTLPIFDARAAARALGGAKILYGPGTFISGNQDITNDKFVYHDGSGVGATIIKLKNGANTDLFSAQTSMINTSTQPGVLYNFGFSNMTLDGNKANQTAGPSWPLRMYAYGFKHDNLEIRNGYSGNWQNDWAAGNNFASDSMEAQVINVKTHDSNGIGIDFLGPHDSQFLNVVSFSEAIHTLHVGSHTGGCQFSSSHFWYPVPAVATVYGADTYTRANQSGWGTSSSGQVWSELAQTNNVVPAISGNTGVVTRAGGGGPALPSVLLCGTQTPTDVDVKVDINQGGNQDNYLGPCWRVTDLNNHYQIGTFEGIVYIQKVVGGVTTTISSFTMPANQSTTQTIRVQMFGSTIRVKMWITSVHEPDTWNYAGTDSAFSSGGNVGVIASVSAAAPFFDNFNATNVVPQHVAVLAESNGTRFLNCQAESSNDVQVVFLADGCQWIGGAIFDTVGVNSYANGIQLGQKATDPLFLGQNLGGFEQSATDCIIDTEFANINGSCMSLHVDGGGNFMRGITHGQNADGNAYTGSIAFNSFFEFHSPDAHLYADGSLTKGGGILAQDIAHNALRIRNGNTNAEVFNADTYTPNVAVVNLTLGSSSTLYSGSGVPSGALGNNGDFYFRTDTPGTANQRLYVKSAGAWVGIV